MIGRLAAVGCVLVTLLAAPALAAPKREERDTGRITVDLYQADLRNVLRLFAEVGGVNIVVAEEVSGSVTLKLKQVPWRDALRTILALAELEAEERDDIILVAPAQAFARRRTAVLTAREQCLASAPLRTRIVRLSYADAAEMAEHARAALASPRGSVSVDTRTNSLIVRDVDCPK